MRANAGAISAPAGGRSDGSVGDSGAFGRTACVGGKRETADRRVPGRARHAADPQWRWVTHIGPMRSLDVERCYVDNLFKPIPKLTRLYQRWQYSRAARRMAGHQLSFVFSPDIGIGVSQHFAAGGRSRRIYVGFTQDGPWPDARIEQLSAALGRFDAVTVFTEEEKQVYVPRYGLDAQRVHVIPIHTDETEGYRQYPDAPPRDDAYVLSLGSPNRRFKPVVAACRSLGIPLVIITRPWHKNDDLEEMSRQGAEVITDANQMKALTYLKHARLAVMAFDDPTIAGGYTTLMHAMFMRTPFVVTQCLGMAEHVIDGETGFVSPHDDEPALTAAIDRLWTEPGLAESFGEASYRRAFERHSLEAAADSFFELAHAVVTDSE